MTSLNEIKQKIEQKGNLLELSMKELFGAVDVENSEEETRELITKKLLENRIGHIPNVLPLSQNE